jgi:hypothetical protein
MSPGYQLISDSYQVEDGEILGQRRTGEEVALRVVTGPRVFLGGSGVYRLGLRCGTVRARETCYTAACQAGASRITKSTDP